MHVATYQEFIIASCIYHELLHAYIHVPVSVVIQTYLIRMCRNDAPPIITCTHPCNCDNTASGCCWPKPLLNSLKYTQLANMCENHACSLYLHIKIWHNFDTLKYKFCLYSCMQYCIYIVNYSYMQHSIRNSI